MDFSLVPFGIYEDEEYEWFTEQHFNGFYRKRKGSSKAEFLFHFPEEPIDQHKLFQNPVKVGNWLVFPPLSGKNIVLYDMVTEEKKIIPLAPVTEERKVKYNETAKLGKALVRGQFVYFFPNTYPAIVKLDVSTLRVEYIKKWVGQLEKLMESSISPKRHYFFGGTPVMEGDFSLLVCCGIPYLFEFDFSCDKIKFLLIEGPVEAFRQIVYDGSHYWLSPNSGALLTKWKKETGETSCIPITEKWTEPWTLVQKMFLYQDSLYLMPNPNGHFYQVNIKDGTVETPAFLETLLEMEYSFHWSMFPDFGNVKIEDHFLIFFHGKDFRWYKVDLESHEICSYGLERDETANRIISNTVHAVLLEQKKSSLSGYIDFVKSRILETPSEEKETNTIGSAILKATTS